MPRMFRRPPRTPGLPPGTLAPLERAQAPPVTIEVISYDEENFDQVRLEDPAQCFPYRDRAGVSWINVSGVHDTDVVEKIGAHFGLHPLVLEDIVNTVQRPKTEDYEGYLYLTVRMLSWAAGDGVIDSEQVSFILGPNFVISLQERPGDVLDPIRERLRTGRGRIRKMGADYLLYTLVDCIVDGYFAVLERLGEDVEAVEQRLVSDARPETLHRIHGLKKEMIFLRRAVWPLREAIGVLQRRESPLISEVTAVYLRDVYDHTVQVMETMESSRDVISGMLDTYLSTVSNRMNEVMKVLTIIATVFIPLTFVTGVYGMNFRHMPELGWRWGYPLALLVMAVVAALMVVFFRRRKWI